MFDKQQRERAHLQKFVDRFRAQATKARQAQSRIKALERMVDIAPVRAASTITFSFREPQSLPVPLLRLAETSAGYADRRILDKVKLSLSPGDRIALLGANGAGKSTLIKLLAGTLEPLDGERIAARDLAIGYFAQHQLEQLDPKATAVEHLLNLDRSVGERGARDFLGGFGFAGDRALEPVAPFSGGEKARLCLALTVYQKPNLLLLDEPTNHLDLDMREALTEALNDFSGAVVLVSHDRALIRTCCDTLLHVGGGRVSDYEGDLDDYARTLQRSGEPVPTIPQATKPGNRQDDRRDRAEQRAKIAPLRKQLQRVEQRIAQLDKDKRELDTKLADPTLYADASTSQMREMTQRSAGIGSEIEALEQEWLEAQHELDRVESA
jgi:ATP-binding cassette subfamily F protein 3